MLGLMCSLLFAEPELGGKNNEEALLWVEVRNGRRVQNKKCHHCEKLVPQNISTQNINRESRELNILFQNTTKQSRSL
jgi:hypothetical protein